MSDAEASVYTSLVKRNILWYHIRYVYRICYVRRFV